MLDLSQANDRRTAATRIDQLCNSRRVRQSDLARALGITPLALFVRIYGGDVTRAFVAEVARLLEAPPGWPDELPARLPTDLVSLSHPMTDVERQQVLEEMEPRGHAAVEEFEDGVALMERGATQAGRDAFERALSLLEPAMAASLQPSGQAVGQRSELAMATVPR